MSVDLIVEVLKHAPAELNPTERLTLVAIAESCRADSRTTFYRDGWDADELARRVGVSAESLTKVFRSLAAKGCEVRVPHMVKDGRPIFAFKGKQTTFRLPRFAPQRVDEGPGFDASDEAKARTSVRQCLDESPGNRAQSLDERPPLLLKDLPSKNTSSLSAREASIPEQAAAEDRERDDSASQRSKTHQLLLEAGCPEENLDDVEEELRRRFDVRSPAWFRTVHANSELAALVAEVLEALAGPASTPSRAAFIETLQGEPTCDHGVEGGSIAWAHDGWMHCSKCRVQAGWVDVNNQGRTDNRDPYRKRSVSVLRAEQALAVAAQLDREYGHEIRSPADQRVAENQPLYEKYRLMEESA